MLDRWDGERSAYPRGAGKGKWTNQCPSGVGEHGGGDVDCGTRIGGSSFNQNRNKQIKKWGKGVKIKGNRKTTPRLWVVFTWFGVSRGDERKGREERRINGEREN